MPPPDDGTISLRPPDVGAVLRAPKSPDVADAHAPWLSRNGEDDTRYFSIYRGDALVGQIVLHDINWQTGEALVAYDVFERRLRGQGIGAKALALLQRYVAAETPLTLLVVIPSEDNVASRRVAEKCGFRYSRRAREDARLCVFRWDVATILLP